MMRSPLRSFWGNFEKPLLISFLLPRVSGLERAVQFVGTARKSVIS